MNTDILSRAAQLSDRELLAQVPYAAGGEATADNIQLRCKAHDGYEADLYFGSA